jgi:hypothetical protein
MIATKGGSSLERNILRPKPMRLGVNQNDTLPTSQNIGHGTVPYGY